MPEMKTLTIGSKTYDIRDSRIGNLADLNTTDKDSVVEAINETLTRTGPTDQQVQDAVDDYLDTHPTVGGTFTNEAKNALIALLEKVAYIDGNGQTYLDALTAELFAVTVTSITAVFTQGANVVYTNDSLDTLRQYLVVTANYSDGTSAAVTTYTLSGTLAEGTSTITVTYGGETDTFTVNCTVNGWLYHFEQSLASSGSKDFGFSGSVTYNTGHDGTGYSFYNSPSCISASGFTAPVLTGDFTVSYWAKVLNAGSGQGFSPYEHRTDTADLPNLATSANVRSGWSVRDAASSGLYYGLRLGNWGSDTISMRLHNYDNSKSVNFVVTPPSGFNTTAWHHYAWTRKNGTVRFFVDGQVIFTSSIYDRLAFTTQCALGGWYDTASPSTPSSNKSWYDDLFVSEYCKWDSDFDSFAITY